jgi:hypothetical protein
MMGRCEEQPAVLIVLDQADAERDLAAASIACPSCTSGRLRPWGDARTRVLRCLGGVRRSVRPRRARCRDCAATHVLLPADNLPRHADTVAVVVTALLAQQAGAGHRTIAADLDVPADTVRSWLRRAARAEWLRQRAKVRAHELDPMLPAIPPTGSTLGDALAALGIAAAAWRRRLGIAASPWQIIGLLAGGRLVAPVRPAPSG